MSKKSVGKTPGEFWTAHNDWLHKNFPHIYSYLAGSDDFRELRIIARDDGTMLGLIKAWDSNGGPIVAFGSGYDTAGVLMSLNAAINGGKWRLDPPWKPEKLK